MELRLIVYLLLDLREGYIQNLRVLVCLEPLGTVLV